MDRYTVRRFGRISLAVSPENAVFRHRENKKWFALLLRVAGDKLGCPGTAPVWILNVKCDPLMIGSLCSMEGIYPAYHMNKTYWISIAMDDRVPRVLVQDLLEPSKVKGKSHFQLLMGKLPPDHKARWFAGAALSSAEQAMASVMSTVLSRLNAFLDSELEQVLCFDSAIDAEKFASEKSAIFLILPEEDTTKNFMAGLMIQNLSRELFAVADENGGKLQNRVVLFCDEFGTMPPFDVLPLFSAGRSRRLTLVPIIQSLAQLEKNYGKEGSEIIQDNCQDTIFGGFAPNSQTAEVLSKALGNRTVLSGSVSRGNNDPSQSLQMMERPLLTPDELKSIPKGSFIVQKTGQHPMRTRLRLFLEWGITFEEEYRVEEQAARRVYYADQNALTRAIVRKYPPKLPEQKTTRSVKGEGQLHDTPVQEMVVAEDIDYDRMPHKRTPYNLPRQEVDR